MTDNGILMVDAEVWHFADWQPLCNLLKAKFGAIDTNWLSDEYANDYYGQLDV